MEGGKLKIHEDPLVWLWGQIALKAHVNCGMCLLAKRNWKYDARKLGISIGCIGLLGLWFVCLYLYCTVL